ncbi:MAG: selenocysteine-specific translation elongation factor [Acidimicrobiales bacterium mtb01]|nr:selenocysteine-specific translation elongation factor [Actinomycetota bacterium]TEX48365.1 MAG: selenocysteine-specific translation elongation factor [Acidimicrobiales bacterium mtb01]
MRIFATAGHVDHGKSSLVTALTGTNPDRWREERERGMTIDLGFAHFTLPSGREVSLIDVPGHIRFINNMLAGVGGIHGAILVVDAHEGWMPQTEEHLRILELAGTRHGVVVVSRIDLVDDDEAELTALDIRERASGTFLAEASIVKVSTVRGDGLDDLRRELDLMMDASPGSIDHGRPRLFVDRVFAPKGSGTVVTGTLTDGSLSVGDTMTVQPLGREVRVRGIQTHGRVVESIEPGHRVALNLSGIEHAEVRRGHAVVRADEWHSTTVVDTSFTALASLDHDVTRRGAYTMHVGSDEMPVRLRVLGDESIRPGSLGFIRLHLAEPRPLLMGDRFVIRESGRDETVGGGVIRDVAPLLTASRARPLHDDDANVDRIVAERGWIDAIELRRLTGSSRTPTVARWVVDPVVLKATTEWLRSRIAAVGTDGLNVSVLDERERALLATFTDIQVTNGFARAKGADDPLLSHPEIGTIRAGGCAPAAPTVLTNPELRRLQKAGVLFERDGEWFHIDALETARIAAAGLLAAHPNGFTMSQFREALGVTRKHAVPIATELDARGITRRRGDVRIAGPRLTGA